MTDANNTFHLPTKPFNHIDALNRAAVATGSPTRAIASEGADYNGHSVRLAWNTTIGSWQAYYIWSGIQYVVRARARHTAEAAARAVRAFYDAQGRGARAGVCLKDAPAAEAEAMRAALKAEGFVEGSEPECEWRTWVHGAAHRLLRAERQGLRVDATRLLDYASEEEWLRAAYVERRQR